MFLVVAKWFFPTFCNAVLNGMSKVKGVTCLNANKQRAAFDFDVAQKHRTYHVCIRVLKKENSKCFFHINIHCEIGFVHVHSDEFFPTRKDLYNRGYNRNVAEIVQKALRAIIQAERRAADKKRHDKRMLLDKKMKSRIVQVFQHPYVTHL